MELSAFNTNTGQWEATRDEPKLRVYIDGVWYQIKAAERGGIDIAVENQITIIPRGGNSVSVIGSRF